MVDDSTLPPLEEPVPMPADVSPAYFEIRRYIKENDAFSLLAPTEKSFVLALAYTQYSEEKKRRVAFKSLEADKKGASKSVKERNLREVYKSIIVDDMTYISRTVNAAAENVRRFADLSIQNNVVVELQKAVAQSVGKNIVSEFDTTIKSTSLRDHYDDLVTQTENAVLNAISRTRLGMGERLKEHLLTLAIVGVFVLVIDVTSVVAPKLFITIAHEKPIVNIMHEWLLSAAKKSQYLADNVFVEKPAEH